MPDIKLKDVLKESRKARKVEAFESNLAALETVKNSFKQILNIVVDNESMFKQLFENDDIVEEISHYYKMADLSCRSMIKASEIDKRFKQKNESSNTVADARAAIAKYSKDQVEFVQKAYDEYVHEVSDAAMNERSSNGLQVKTDYAAGADEDGLLNAAQFEELWNAVEKISKAHAHV